jgi:hypothetical protein
MGLPHSPTASGVKLLIHEKSTTLYTCCIISLYVIIVTCFIEDLL